jgi:hypothetical protein
VEPTSTPTLGDLDGDGDLDLLSGDLAGGLLYLDRRQGGPDPPPPPQQGGDALLQSYPNPFDEEATLKVIGSEEELTLTLFDAVGRALRSWTLAPKEEVQTVAWDGTTAAGTPAPSGLYVAQLHDGERVLATQKLMRLR